MVSEVWTGWYLSLAYRTDGSVMHYSLSNANKVDSMRLGYERQIKEKGVESDPGLPAVNTSDGRGIKN